MGHSKVPVVEDGSARRLRSISNKKLRNRLKQLEQNIRNILFPVKIEWFIWAIIIFGVLHHAGAPIMRKTVDDLQQRAENLFGISIWNRVLAIGVVGFVICWVLVLIIRWTLTFVLYYNGWLYETVGRPVSLPTKAFMKAMRFMNTYASFFSFNDLLPWLPVPSLSSTVTKYLRSVRPLLDDEKYNEVARQAKEFENGVGKKLQRKLWLKWLTSRNYVSDWWKEIVYMRYRKSLVYTNVGMADMIYQQRTCLQAARAANVTILKQLFFREMLKKQSMKPITLGGVPLCSNQYLEYYKSIRLPHEISDRMVRCENSRHIAVYCKGCWYKIDIIRDRRLLKPAELERTLQGIIDRIPDPVDGEAYLSALTMGPRDLWARIRREKFGKGVNKESLSMIENALEVIFLDEEDRFYDEENPDHYEYEYARTLHGNGYQLWCDKPNTFAVSKNGRLTSNGEHSVVDALIFVHVLEYIKYHEYFISGYTPDGHCKGNVDIVPSAERLKWELDEETKLAINECYALGKSCMEDFGNAYLIFTDYGKNFMKEIQVSPDAFIQMALQMAYFKDQGKFELTYEPAITRLFKDGRTETVRSCTIESCDFVRAMLDETVDDATRLRLLRTACDVHQNSYRNAMVGRGIDRHLFALYIVAKYLEISCPFLDSVFSMTYALSTSQTPQHQIPEYASKQNKEKELFWPAGSFCCPEGSKYGVSYTVSGAGDMLSFHIATWKSAGNTDARRFRDEISRCLREMRQMCERAKIGATDGN